MFQEKNYPQMTWKFSEDYNYFFLKWFGTKEIEWKITFEWALKKQFIDSFTLCLNRQSWIFDTWEGELLDSFLSCISIVFPKVSWRKCIIDTKCILNRKCDTQKAMRRLFLMNSTCHHHIITFRQILSMTKPDLLFIFWNNCTPFPL